MADSLCVEPDGERAPIPCPCCGQITRRIWGYVHEGTATSAAYFVDWVPGRVDQHGAAFDLILGRWGENASPADRVAVSLILRRTPQGPQFMVVDAGGRPHDDPGVVSIALSRSQVIGTPTAQRAFAIVDAVWLGEGRIAELVGGAG